LSQLPSLSRPQKAAAILVAMGKPAAGRLLRFFKQEELRMLIEGARSLRTIPQGELERIVAEFEGEFTEGAGLLDSADEMDTILTESLTPEEVNAIMGGEAPPEQEAPPPPVWPDIEKLDAARVGEFLAAENAQLAAFVLSKLSNQAAAAILVTLPKSRRGEVVKRMMSSGSVTPFAQRLVEDQLRAGLLATRATKDSSAGQARLASVLNELDKSELEDVMGDLAASGGADLEAIRSRLFSFEDVVLLTQKQRVALFDGISTEIVTLALRGAQPDLTEAVLSSVGVRARRMMEAELANADGGSGEETNRARKSIASTAIRLAGEGVIELPNAREAA
jgi:flagellar motor switch protein FliG